MNKKKYFELLEEYDYIISQKQFNNFYYEEKQLEEITSALTKKVELIIGEINVDIFHSKNSRLQSMYITNSVLLEAIKDQKTISGIDYKKSYYETRWFGLLSTKQLFVILIIYIVILAFRALIG